MEGLIIANETHAIVKEKITDNTADSNNETLLQSAHFHAFGDYESHISCFKKDIFHLKPQRQIT